MKRRNKIEENKLSKPNNITVENKVIEKSIDSKIDLDLIDNSNAYYSERYGWTLRKN